MRKFILNGIAVMAMSSPLFVSAAAADVPRPANHVDTAQALTVTVDASATKAVLEALGNPALTMGQALRVAALPGNQGLIRKARSYGRPGTDELFAQALVAAARRDDTAPDPGRFRFAPVRDRAAQIEATLAKLEDPAANLLAGVKARIAEYTPPAARGHVTGYLIVGGTSGGFAFGDPEFFLNLERFPSAPLATTIMQHELFHAVQGVARKANGTDTACVAKIPHGEELSKLFAALETEGSASLVGDVGEMPAGIDKESDDARRKARRNVELVDSSITLLELSVHALDTGAKVSYDDIYALGFYGDEVLYGLGYVMARAIAAEEGNAAIAALTGRPGALFVQRYRNLKGYGKSEKVPALHAGTLQAADRLAACAGGSAESRVAAAGHR